MIEKLPDDVPLKNETLINVSDIFPANEFKQIKKRLNNLKLNPEISLNRFGISEISEIEDNLASIFNKINFYDQMVKKNSLEWSSSSSGSSSLSTYSANSPYKIETIQPSNLSTINVVQSMEPISIRKKNSVSNLTINHSSCQQKVDNNIIFGNF